MDPEEATPEEGSSIAEVAKDILETLLSKMGIAGSVEAQAKPFVQEEDDDATVPLAFNIKGNDLGLLIGRRGHTLSDLQYIVRLIIGHQTKTWASIFIDVEGYRQRRYEALQSLARRMAEQVKATKMPFTLEPMSAYERRIIHLALADNPDVTTQSVGEGEARKVVLLPREQ